MHNSAKSTRIVFDVNETLLDLKVMLPAFEETFGDKNSLSHWFMHLLQYSWVDTLTQNYHNFDQVGEAVLDMTAHAFQTQINTQKKKALVALMRKLPPHPEVPVALEKLKKAGFQVYTFTNSPRNLLQDQMRSSHLGHLFDQWLSIEQIGSFKPHLNTYHTLAYKLGIEHQQIRFVAAHAWDIAGALKAGLKGAYISRGGKPYYSLAEIPDILGNDVAEIVDEIISKDH